MEKYSTADLVEMLRRALAKTDAPEDVKRLQRWTNNKIIFRATKKFEEFRG